MLRTAHPKKLAAIFAVFAMVLGLLISAPATLAAAASIPIGTLVPSPDVLNVDFASGAPVDHAQSLPAITVGTPTVGADATLGTSVATFNGTTDAYQFDFTNQFSKLTSALTLECQFRWNGAALSTLSASAFPSLCSDEQGGGVNIEVYQNKLNASINVGGYKYAYASATAVVPGEWYDAVATWDGQNVKLYLDGQLVATTAAAGALTLPNSASLKWTLGADVNSAGGIEAEAPVSLAASRVWSTALTADQVTALDGSHAVTVTKSGQGTATAAPINASAGNTVTLSQTAAAGYRFTGWQVTSPSDGSVTIGSDGTFAMPNAAVMVQANFAPNTYAVHYDGNGADGGTMTDGSFTYDQAAALATNAYTRTGFHFVGWATTSSGSATYSDGASVSNLTATNGGTATLYAVWHADVAAGVTVPSPDVLSVDFATGAPVDHAQNLAATTIGAPTVAADPTLGVKVATFNGSTDAYQYDFTSQFSKLTHAVTLECQFRWNGAALSTLSASAFPSLCSGEQSGGLNVEVYSNKLNASIYVGGYKYAYASATAVVPGQWYDAIATWDATSLKFYVDGQLVATTAAAGTMTVPSSASLKWTLGADTSSSGGIEAPAPVSLAASRIWSTALTAAQVAAESGAAVPHGITVTKSGQGTATASPTTARVGDTVTLSQTAAVGYHFAGWQVTDGGVVIGTDGTFTMPGAAVTVSATFAPSVYAVHYDGNGADGGLMADGSFTYGQSAALATNTFKRSGFSFAGWATSATGRPAYSDGASVSNLTATDGGTVTLYAVWIPAGEFLVDVDFGAHGTASTDDWASLPGATVTLTATPDTGYHLAGWQVTDPSDGSVTVAADGTFTMPAANVTVNATFAADTYTVTYNGNGATSGTIADSSLVYDTPATLPTNTFTRDGFQFAGWATSATGPVAYTDGAIVSNLTPVNSATVTLYAVWTTSQAAVGSWPTLAAGFVTDTFHLPAVPVSGAVSQTLVGLWNGAAPTSFTKVSGDSWLSVSSSGVITGTAPSSAPQNDASITVSATNGTTTSQLLVEVTVDAAAVAPQLEAASWNAWDGGSHVTDAVGKNLAVIASRGLDVIGFQEGGASMAQQVAAALGWNVYSAGDLGIVSAYSMASTNRVAATAAAPAAAVTINVNGQSIRVWDAYLDENASDTAARATQAQAIATEVHSDVAAASTAPVLFLGDLGASSLSSTFTSAGLTDSFRVANPDATAVPGVTWPLFPTAGVTADRIDYIDYAGGLHVQAAQTLTVGVPSATAPASNSWASDHAAVVTLFTVGSGGTTTPPTLPVVSVTNDTVAYQVGHGPANGAALLADAGATVAPTSATLAVDLSGVDFSTAGWYTALITATGGGVTSDPVAETVRVAPVPNLTLGTNTASFNVGDTIDQPSVLGQLLPALDVAGSVNVDLSTVKSAVAASYPVTVTATDQWGFAVTQAATVVVNGVAAPITFTSAASATFSVGTAGTFSVVAIGSPAPTVTEAGTLPAGVTFDPASGTLSGTPAVGSGGTYALVFTAANGSGSSVAQTFTLTVNEPSAFTGSTTASFTIGVQQSFTVKTTGFPVAAISSSGTLPAGLTFKDNGNGTATISGTPSSSSVGGYSIPLSATNGLGTPATESLALTVLINQPTPTTGVVAGTVTNTQGGSHLANICIYLYPHGTSSAAVFASCTRADGGYEIDGVTPGSYDVAFADPASTYVTQWDNGTATGASSQAQAAPITVTAAGRTTAINAALVAVPAGNLTGVVTDVLTGTPLANVCVYVYPHGNSAAAAYATCTAPDGSYAIYGAASGSYDVAFFDPTAAHATQWRTGTLTGASTQAGAVAVTVGSGNQTTGDVNAALALVAAGNVTGAVTDASTNAPVSGVCVYLYKHGVSSSATYATCTGSDGGWFLGSLVPGSYDVAFSDPSATYTTQWSTGTAGGAASQAGAQPITITAGNSTLTGVNAAMVSVPTGSVHGTVTARADGQPVANICVYLYQHGVSTAASYSTCTLADGTYALPVVAAGSYDVAFFDPAQVYATVWHSANSSGSPTQAGALAVVVPTGNKSVSVPAALSPIPQ